MAIKSCFFNSVNGDRVYNAYRFAEYFASFIANGVFPNPSTGFQVMSDEGMKVKISPGKAWINGYFAINDDDVSTDIEVADGVQDRIDRVVLKYSLLSRDIQLSVKKGVPSENPLAPELTRNLEEYELGLATISINRGVIKISQADITDTRLDNSVCGIVHGLVEQVDTTTLFNQYQTWLNNKKTEFDTDLEQYKTNKKNEINNWFGDKKNEWESWYNTNTTAFFNAFNTWFEDVKNLLNGDVAGNIINKIDKVDKKVDKLNSKVDTTAANLNQKMQETVKNATEIVNAHSDKKVTTEEGVHGFRVYQGAVQYYDDIKNKWADIEDSTGIPPGNIQKLKIVEGGNELLLSWQDPEDTVVDNQTLSSWEGTKVVYKSGSYPENSKDGVIILDNKERNKYKTNPFKILGLNNGETYYIQLFPYSNNKAYNLNPLNRISGTPQASKVMTVKIDTTNPNPETALTYLDDAAEMVPGSDKWDKFFGNLPCLFKNGEVVGYLKKDDFTKFEDGSFANIESGNTGDVMIQFPRRGIRIEKIGTDLYIKMTDARQSENFTYYAHSRGNIEKDFFYLGAYLGGSDGRLTSLSKKKPSYDCSLKTFRELAQKNGNGYELQSYYQIIFLQVMYILKYKNLNSELYFNKGCSYNHDTVYTGGANKKGMDYKSTSPQDNLKIFGVEDLYSLDFLLIDGAATNENFELLTTTDNFNNEQEYVNRGKIIDKKAYGYISDVQGTSETGFLAKKFMGSSTTFFCDTANVDKSNRLTIGGGGYNENGIFKLFLSFTENSIPSSRTHTRLMYL